MNGVYVVLGIFTAVVIFKAFKTLSKIFRRLIMRINWKTTEHKRNHINREILEKSIKFVEKNYLHY